MTADFTKTLKCQVLKNLFLRVFCIDFIHFLRYSFNRDYGC